MGIDKRRHTQPGRNNDSNGGTELHSEPTRGRVQGKTVTQVAHDVITVCPDTDGDSGTAKDTGECGLARERPYIGGARLTGSRWGPRS